MSDSADGIPFDLMLTESANFEEWNQIIENKPNEYELIDLKHDEIEVIPYVKGEVSMKGTWDQ